MTTSEKKVRARFKSGVTIEHCKMVSKLMVGDTVWAVALPAKGESMTDLERRLWENGAFRLETERS